MTESITGIILAGGRSRRFGSPKALADWRGRPLVERVVGSVRPAVSEVLVMVKETAPFAFLEGDGVRVVRDRLEAVHALGGIESGLSAMTTRAAFVCGADMPSIRPELIRALADASGERAAAVVPVWKGRLEPLCAIYTRDCLEPIRGMIEAGRLRVLDLFTRVSTRRFTETEVRAVDAGGRSFADIDTRGDYRRLHRPRTEGRIHAG